MLWCFKADGLPDARSHCNDDNEQKKCTDDTGPETHQKAIFFDEIACQLSDKHAQSFTVEQIRAWAHLIQIKKHESYDYPLDKCNKGAKKKVCFMIFVSR